MAVLKEVTGLSAEDIRKVRSLKPGMIIDIQVVTQTTAKRVKTEFIGMDGNRMLILRFPDESKWGSLRDALYVDSPLIVRCILEGEAGEVVAFKSRVVFVLPKPVHLLFIAFPVAIQSQSLRSETRAQIQVPVTIFDAETERTMAMGTLMDISNNGCRITTNRAETKKIECRDITIRLNGQSAERFELQGSIVNLKQDEVFYSYGVQFKTSEADVENLINRLMVEV